jgi:paraquat-inducible protein B
MEPNKHPTHEPNTAHSTVDNEDNHEALLLAVSLLMNKINHLTFAYRPIVTDVDCLSDDTSPNKSDILKQLTTNIHSTIMTIIDQLNDHKREFNKHFDKFITNTSKLITELEDSAEEANRRLQDFNNSTTMNVTPNLASTMDTRKRPYDMTQKTQAAPMNTTKQSDTMPTDILHGNRRNSNSTDSA